MLVNNAKKQHKRLTWVSINIGILKRSEKQLYLKPVRGKRVAIKVNTNESYSKLLQEAISKFRTFHKDLLDTECEYVLTFENGDVANIIPGTTAEFTLSKHKEEILKDFKNIVLFSASTNDQTVFKKYQQSLDLFSDFNDREMLLTLIRQYG